MVALKYWGTSTTTNFPISNYEKELEEMKHMTRQEFVASIRSSKWFSIKLFNYWMLLCWNSFHSQFMETELMSKRSHRREV
ncbi:AP2-like ethylene-responsive transcription factor AIL5 [Camellia sinensis]|uniref:AP2-like ethylene-responsive transcription factor AIL5 n=1 Tax=Camellia sinensis TaxID=4442 RepID=UPI00103575B7|nr:AP2-like ethylene-responsive transcription factor AIL5 [Camellia sinensis]